MSPHYTAQKSRNQGREGWSVIFRHPVRLDPSTGRPGRRVRRGLGTSVDTEADVLVEQLNEILRTQSLWDPHSRQQAAGLFDGRVVDVFYEDLETSRTDYRKIRDDLLALPGAADGYKHVLLVGTTGAGKTTVVRQLLGTDPETERFPSTSTAKTTVADTEIVLTQAGPYRAAVTFAGRDEVIDHLTENVSAAALALLQGKSEEDALRRLVDHVNQRFRFSYVLGRPELTADDDILDDEDDEEEEGATEDVLGLADLDVIDPAATVAMLVQTVPRLRSMVEKYAVDAREELRATDDDARVVEEIVEETLDTVLRSLEEFHSVVDGLLREIELRFSLLGEGELRRTRQGWPLSWTLETADRAVFLKTVMRFSSNYAPLFGRLLTPLVNGIRVAGPFVPTWAEASDRLVLIDVEGLGHTPKSATSVSTDLAKRIDEVDAILVVDNATAPMQAAPVAALKAVAVSGNSGKLHFLFTHFDHMKADNLPRFSDRKRHVLASVENVLNAMGKELGPIGERAVRVQLERHCYFVGGMHKPLSAGGKEGKRTAGHMRLLSADLSADEAAPDTGPARPVFDRMALPLAVSDAARSFHTRWRGLLGQEYNPDAPKQHWTRVKALARRLGEGWSDEYDSLKPVADLRTELQVQIFLMLQRPVRWEGGEPTEEERQAVINEISGAVTGRLYALTEQRLKDDVQNAWLDAYRQRGPKSTFARARIIDADVFGRGAPVPTAAPSPDNSFLKAVADILTEVADETRFVLD
ncbi:hypothetical protein OG592_34585 [Streptomyces avidinii]|uniref:hypothetical protein n=1 Tax=Streptomyces avidinii TaxID=1895 RepID=UPI003865975A|nr:hypothetical protein OG592_34585 [Streptomyces avidinii]